MKRLGILLAATALSVCAIPASAGTNRYNLANFTEVEASNHVRVIVRQGDAYSVTVEEPFGRFDHVVLSVRGSTLIASRRGDYIGNWWQFRDPPRYTITVIAPAFTRITARNHARVSANVSSDSLSVVARDHGKVSGAFNVRTLALAASGHGDLTGEITAGVLTVNAHDHGDLTYRGRCDSLALTASSHAEVIGREMDCGAARVESSDHADVSVRATKSLRGRARNHGDIDVHGAPLAVDVEAYDHGSVRHL